MVVILNNAHSEIIILNVITIVLLGLPFRYDVISNIGHRGLTSQRC